MAFKYKKSIIEDLSLTGILSDDTSEITYVENKIEHTVNTSDILEKFAGEGISLKIQKKDDVDLSLDIEE